MLKGANTIDIDTDGLASGNYLISVELANKIRCRQIIIKNQ